MNRNNEGFTLPELMVALIVGSLVVSFTYSLFTFTERMFVGWKKKAELHNMVERAIEQIAFDIEHSKHIDELTDSTLVVKQELEKIVGYNFRSTMAFRNGDRLATDDGAVLSITVKKPDKEYVITAHAQSGALRSDIERTARPLESGKEQFN
jgi:prepilin-type N-terminal cleavage/methylation domain-containing protein